MELYHLSKYQNIADRLKRLSSPPSVTSNEFKSQVTRQKQRPFQDRKDSSEQTWKGKYTQAAYSKYSTLNADKEQSTYAQMQNHLISPRQIRPSEKIERFTSSKNAENQISVSRVENENKTVRKDQLIDSKKPLGKVMSDGSCKIDQILESFNHYKQNKEKFLSNLNKRLPNSHYQELNHTPEILEQQSKINNSKYSQQKGLFLEIDNIWNSTQDQNNDSGPIFERSFTRRQQVELITDVFSPTIMQPTERAKNVSRSKLILKNLVKQVETQNFQGAALKSIMSPRGPRIPGRICRNNDKTFTAFGRS